MLERVGLSTWDFRRQGPITGVISGMNDKSNESDDNVTQSADDEKASNERNRM